MKSNVIAPQGWVYKSGNPPEEVRIVIAKAVIDLIDEMETAVHLSFRPSAQDIIKLIDHCKKLKMISIPESYMTSISKSTLDLLEMHNVRVLEGYHRLPSKFDDPEIRALLQ